MIFDLILFILTILNTILLVTIAIFLVRNFEESVPKKSPDRPESGLIEVPPR